MKVGEAEVEVKLNLEEKTADIYFRRTNSPAFHLPDLDANECRDLTKLFKTATDALDIMPSVHNMDE